MLARSNVFRWIHWSFVRPNPLRRKPPPSTNACAPRTRGRESYWARCMSQSHAHQVRRTFHPACRFDALVLQCRHLRHLLGSSSGKRSCSPSSKPCMLSLQKLSKAKTWKPPSLRIVCDWLVISNASITIASNFRCLCTILSKWLKTPTKLPFEKLLLQRAPNFAVLSSDLKLHHLKVDGIHSMAPIWFRRIINRLLRKGLVPMSLEFHSVAIWPTASYLDKTKSCTHSSFPLRCLILPTHALLWDQLSRCAVVCPLIVVNLLTSQNKLQESFDVNSVWATWHHAVKLTFSWG